MTVYDVYLQVCVYCGIHVEASGQLCTISCVGFDSGLYGLCGKYFYVVSHTPYVPRVCIFKILFKMKSHVLQDSLN